MMIEMNMPLTYWAEAVHTAVHIMNRTPTTAIHEISPYERLYGIKPTVSYMKIFGSVCYVHVPNEARKKMEPKAVKCIFLGYPVEKKSYKCYDPTTRQVYVSRDVRFCEHEPWYKPKPATIEDEYEEQENVRRVVDESGPSTRTISGPHITEESTGSVNPWSGLFRDKKQDERGKKKMFEESSGDESFDEEHGLPHLRTPGNQFSKNTIEEERKLQSFFNWYYVGVNVALLVASTIVAYVQLEVSWAWGFAIPTAVMAISIIIFLAGSPLYYHVIPSGSAYAMVARVIVAAFHKRKLSLPPNPK
ncbi:hypothetical protein L7F22_041311 [Adiantum nelumboides]|nr:hypothetical protein [Adiantum nelumboides]